MDIGGWDTVIKREEYDRLFYNQQETITSFAKQPETIPNDADVEPEIKKTPKQKPAIKPRPAFVSTQYGVKPSVSMVAENGAKYESSYHTTTQSNEEMSSIDLSAVKEGVTVTHKVFGEGIVTGIDKSAKHIRVKFSVGEKMFIFPDAFKNGFLKI